MTAVRRVRRVISSGLYYAAAPFQTYGGAIDIIVVEQEDGSYRSSPWYVRFGRASVPGNSDRPVRISVNGSEANVQMYVDNSGQALFVREVTQCNDNSEPKHGQSDNDYNDGHSNQKTSDLDFQSAGGVPVQDDASMESPSSNSMLDSLATFDGLDMVDNEENTLQDPEMLLVSSDGHILAAENPSNQVSRGDLQLSSPESPSLDDAGTLGCTLEAEDVHNSEQDSDIQMSLGNSNGHFLTAAKPSDVESTDGMQLNNHKPSTFHDTATFVSSNGLGGPGSTSQDSDPEMFLVSSDGHVLAKQPASEEIMGDLQLNMPENATFDSSAASSTMDKADDAGNSLHDSAQEMLLVSSDGHLLTAQSPENNDVLSQGPNKSCRRVDEVEHEENSLQDSNPKLLLYSSNINLLAAERTSNEENADDIESSEPEVPGEGDVGDLCTDDNATFPHYKPDISSSDIVDSSSTQLQDLAECVSAKVPVGTVNELQRATMEPNRSEVNVNLNFDSKDDQRKKVHADKLNPGSESPMKPETALEDVLETMHVDSEEEIEQEDRERGQIEPGTDGSNASEIPNLMEIGLELSLCGNLLCPGMKRASAEEAFEAHRITEEELKKSASSILKDRNLVVRYANKYFHWEKVAHIAFGKSVSDLNFSTEIEDFIPIGDEENAVINKDADRVSPPSSWRWSMLPILSRSVRSFQKTNSTASSEDVFYDAETSLESPRMENDNKKSVKEFIKTNFPTTEQIASLNLEYGKNRVAFTVSAGSSAEQQIIASIYLWRWNARIVISDIDGTITKSDVLGQFMPLVGRDWTQSGVARLFSAIEKNGYRLLFLSARAIAQAYITRNFLVNLKQDGDKLPDGPVVVSPDGLFPALYREVVKRAPHEFKIACLEDIKALFPSGYNPFYAGFGNRDTDELAYRKIGIPDGRIFIINPKGEVAIRNWINVKTYGSLHDLVHDIFPPHFEQEEFNDVNYWKLPLPEIAEL